MRAVIFLLVLSLADGIRILSTQRDEEDTTPKFAYPSGGHPVIWQRPKGEVKGILLYLHGCGSFITDMFTNEGKDGFVLDACRKGTDQNWAMQWKNCTGKKAEMMLRRKARDRGYLVATVQGGQGKDSTRCTNTLDVPFIKTTLKHVRAQEKLDGVKVINMGFSSGGRVVPELAQFLGKSASCNVVVSNEVRSKGTTEADVNIPEKYPKSVPMLFVHEPHDNHRNKDIRKNIHQFRAKNIKTEEIQVGWGPKHFLSGAAYVDEIIDFCESGKVPEKSHDQPPADWTV